MTHNRRNGQPDEGVCAIQHTVHSDELFVMRRSKRNGSQMMVCAIYSIRFTRMNFVSSGNTMETVRLNKMCVIGGKQVHNQKCVRSINHKRGCKEPSKRCKMFAREDAPNSFQILVACAIRAHSSVQ